MSKQRKGSQNAESRYYQTVLSGWSNFGKPDNWHDDSTQEVNAKTRQGTGTGNWKQQKSYQILIPVIVSQVGVSGNEHIYQISFPDDIDLPISAYSQRSKKAHKSSDTVHYSSGKKNSSIRLVYGISENGQHTLSPVIVDTIQRNIAQIYSAILGRIDRTLQCRLHVDEKTA